jgi:predicted DNA binding CopG/RHH family protein
LYVQDTANSRTLWEAIMAAATKPVKVTVNLPVETVEAIKKIAGERGTTVTEALRQVIESQRYLQQEIQQGGKVLIEKPDQSLRQLIFNIPPQDKR